MILTAAEQAKQKVELRAYHRQYWAENKETIKRGRKEYQREYARRNGRTRRLRNLYGLTDAEWAALFTSQGSCCAICKVTVSNPTWHTDHDHATNIVRGILCTSCNTGLGKLGDTAEGLRRALAYLEKNDTHSGTTADQSGNNISGA